MRLDRFDINQDLVGGIRHGSLELKISWTGPVPASIIDLLPKFRSYTLCAGKNWGISVGRARKK